MLLLPHPGQDPCLEKMAFCWAFVICSCVRLSGCSIKEPVFPLNVSSDKWEVYLMLAQDEANMFLLLFYTFFFTGICRLWLFKYLEVPQHLPSGKGNKCGDKDWVPDEPGKMDGFNRCYWGPFAPCLMLSNLPIHHPHSARGEHSSQPLTDLSSAAPVSQSAALAPSPLLTLWAEAQNKQQILYLSLMLFVSMPWESASSCHWYLAVH